MPEFAPVSLVFILFTLVIWALLALVFLMIASRVVTRVVLDEIDKHGRRKGPV
jgi:hypothetical protein